MLTEYHQKRHISTDYYEFQSSFHSNYVVVLHHCRDAVRYWLKITKFPHSNCV